MDKRMKGRQAPTDGWSILLAFGYAGLALACYTSLTLKLFCVGGARDVSLVIQRNAYGNITHD